MMSDFAERTKDKIEAMTPEEVLAHHKEAQETIEEPVFIEVDEIPKRIFIQQFEDPKTEGFQTGEEVTWCVDQINDNDVEYVRKDLYDNIQEAQSRSLLFEENLLAVMSESYRDGMARASMGLDFDFKYSRTKVNIERGNFFYENGKKLPIPEFKEGE